MMVWNWANRTLIHGEVQPTETRAVPQIRGSVSIAGDAVPFEAEGVGDPQPAVDQGHQPVGRVASSAEVAGMLGLSHDVLGECPGRPFAALGQVLGKGGERHRYRHSRGRT